MYLRSVSVEQEVPRLGTLPSELKQNCLHGKFSLPLGEAWELRGVDLPH